VQAAAEILAAARVPLARVREEEHPDLGWLFRCEAFTRAIAAHGARLALYQRAFEELLARADGQSIPVLVVKAAPGFPYESSNLDLLVPPESMREAGALLAGLGYHRLGHYREPHKSLFKKFGTGDERVIFHLHEELGWQGAVFLDRQEVWRRRLPLDGFRGAWRLHPGDLVAHTLAHAVYENAALRASDLMRILRARPLDADLAASVTAQARRQGWGTGLRLALQALARLERSMRGTSECAEALGWRGSGAAPGAARLQVDLGRIRSRLLMAGKILRSGPSPWPRRILALAGYLLSRIRSLAGLPPHGGMLVTLSGVDGSGKSSQAGRLLAFLTECDAKGKVIWARGGSTSLMLWLKACLRRLGGGGGALQVRPAAAPLRPGWQVRLWPWVVALELALVAVLRVAPALARRRIVICDRYLLDAEVDLYFRLNRADPRRLLPWRILRRLAPSPHVRILLDVGAREIRARKDVGMDSEHIEERRAAYAKLADPGILRLDAGGDADRVAALVSEAVLTTLNRRSA
jgi:thymidylate kinase